jgi:type II secretory pathway pseudopilin PulG
MGTARGKLSKLGGFALIEVMIATGVMGIVALGIAQMIANQNKGVKNVENISDLTQLQNQITQALNSPTACMAMLENVTTTNPGGNNIAFGNIKQLYAPVSLSPGQQSGHITIEGPATNPVGPGISMSAPTLLAGSTYTSTMTITAITPNGLGGPFTRNITVPIVATLNAAMVITECALDNGWNQSMCQALKTSSGGGTYNGAVNPATCTLGPDPGTGNASSLAIWSAPGGTSLGSSKVTESAAAGLNVAEAMAVTGTVTIGTGLNTVTVAAGGITTTSDERLKKEIHELQGSLDKILNLRGVSYYWKDPSASRARQVGVIAQEVEKQFPELVRTDDKGMKSVAYQNLVAPLIEAVKAQQRDITELHGEITKLRARLQDFEKEHKSNSRTLSGLRAETPSDKHKVSGVDDETN